MNMATKKDIFKRYSSEYNTANSSRKSEILDHVVDVAQMHRKSVIRKFRTIRLYDSTKKDSRGRAVYYTADVTTALKTVWEMANEACAEILHPVINNYINDCIRDGLWDHGDEATHKLRAMSERTVKRRVVKFEQVRQRKGITTTKPSHIKQIIPIFKGPWDNLPPGHGQIDTVVHCGDSLQGDMVYTVNYTDAATYWVVPRAQWNKGQQVTRASIEDIKTRLPFTLIELHPDTGSEFVNWHLKDYCDMNGIRLSRSEPGKKNDNMFVEERNGHVVRRYLGYIRLDDPKLLPLINEFYDVLTLYLNHFIPVRRTLSKEKIGSKYRRTFEKRARTPYERTLLHPDVPKTVKDDLIRQHEMLNPLILKRKIDRLKKQIFEFKKV
jgi:hypothetical protein